MLYIIESFHGGTEKNQREMNDRTAAPLRCLMAMMMIMSLLYLYMTGIEIERNYTLLRTEKVGK